jgi:hypothetical protein
MMKILALAWAKISQRFQRNHSRFTIADFPALPAQPLQNGPLDSAFTR